MTTHLHLMPMFTSKCIPNVNLYDMHMDTFSFTFNTGSNICSEHVYNVQRMATVPASYAAGQERGLIESFNTCSWTYRSPFKR